ncbi:RNA polymerase sigma factor [Arcicella rosea]|uniref:RNA polymerase sigma factor (Sigma-70 family) n=1 Tax=Arcicella rosea TaxID=502909 RepID=A0A841EK05_9BACT|nr:sigma-70 family RNA polymerase sigma factor [Arcicella rosea]MBB6002534.1 RNA polymerase sigma factor (sigma-70 family) [Arcicella rosea]
MALDISDETLWKSLREGNEWAFSSLFERYFCSMVNYGSSLMSHSNQVQDCVQDVFVDIWLYRQSLQDKVVVKAYLLSSVRKRIARLYEREHIFRQTASVDGLDFLLEFSIEEQLIHDEITASKVNHLNKLLNMLPARQKEALYLRYHQGLTVEQIAEALDINYQSANNLIYRGLQHLRTAWSGDLALLFLVLSRFI